MLHAVQEPEVDQAAVAAMETSTSGTMQLGPYGIFLAASLPNASNTTLEVHAADTLMYES